MATTRPQPAADSDAAKINAFCSPHDHATYHKLFEFHGSRLFTELAPNAAQIKELLAGKSDQEILNFFRMARRYTIYDVRFMQRAFLTTSVCGNKLQEQIGLIDPYNEVVSNLYLGQYPQPEFEIFENEQVGAVVSIVEDYETFYDALHWKSKGIKHFVIYAEDCTAEFSPYDVANAVEFIKDCLDNEASHKRHDPDYLEKFVYVHCKAGRSRSGTVVLAFLARYGSQYGLDVNGRDLDNDINVAHEFIRSKRPNLKVETDKLLRAREALGISREVRPTLRRQVHGDLNDYLCSMDCKDVVSKLISFHAMRAYGVRVQSGLKLALYYPTHRTNHIRELFSDILLSKDGNWYQQLINYEGPVKKFIDANKGSSEYGQKDKDERRDLVKAFIHDINTHLVAMKLLDPTMLKEELASVASASRPQ